MAALTFEEVQNNMLQYKYNPASIQHAVYRAFNGINDGVDLYFNPSTPFTQLLAAGATETAAFFQEHAAESRRRYPLMSQTQEDLYLHMSDEDYINRFAVPTKAIFKFVIPYTELINNMVLEPATGYKKLTIPRNTFFTVGGHVFSLQYPIDIRRLAHDGLQITYNNDVLSPLQDLDSNSIVYEIVNNGMEDMLRFDVEVMQFNIKTRTKSVSKSAETSLTVEITDKFYFARVYHYNPLTSTWDELVTTQAATIYDATEPTAVLTVVNKVLSVRIPAIYVSNGKIFSQIRVDMYETKGPVNLKLSDYPARSTQITWMTYDNTETKSPYSAPLSNMNVMAYSDDNVNGGKDEMSFEELKANVINNSVGPIRQPVTEEQLLAQLRNAGYGLSLDIANVGTKVYLATRDMPKPTLTSAASASSSGRQLLTAASASIETLSASFAQLVGLPSVINNGASVTITPDTLYRMVDGVIQIAPQSEVDRLLALPVDKRALEVSAGHYYYTPLHYVLDSSSRTFEIRPYYLDKPKTVRKRFIKQNDTSLLLAGTSAYNVVRKSGGYTVSVLTRSNTAYKQIPDNQVFVQLAFTPAGERDRAYINGRLVGKTTAGERQYEFDLASTMNITAEDQLELTKFLMYNTEPMIAATPLEGSFDVIYSTSATMPSAWRPNEVDTVLGRHLLPDQIAGINHEQITLHFGDSLSRLWARSRTVVSSLQYDAWEEDLQAFYQDDVYAYDTNGVRLKVIDGSLQYTKLHSKGDPVLLADGSITYEHRKGDLKRDALGNPIASNPRGLVRQIDLMLLEGVYWFATDETTVSYRDDLAGTLVTWVANDLERFIPSLMEQTRLYFFPKTTSGVVDVYVQDDIRKTLNAGQTFNVTLSVSKQVYDNTDLRERLEQITVSTISTILAKSTVTLSEIVSRLREVYNSDVIDVQVSGLGGDANYTVITMVNSTDRLSIAKRLVALADGKLAVEEAVTCNFALHKTV